MRGKPSGHSPVSPAQPTIARQAIQPTRRQHPPLPASPAVPPPLPQADSLFAGFWRKTAVLVAVGLVSTAFGAFFLPGTPAPHSQGRPQPSSAEAPSNLVNLTESAVVPVYPEEQARPTAWSREYRGPAVPPQRQPGPASNLAILIDRHVDMTLARERHPGLAPGR